MNFNLAQINIGRLIASIDNPKIASFVSQLDPINALADVAPGFVWRLQSASGNATDVPYNDDSSIMVNMSVWESIGALRDPAVNEGRERLEHYQQRGATPYAFWISKQFPAPLPESVNC